VEDGVEAAGVGWLDGPGLIITCDSLSSVEDRGRRSLRDRDGL
jgi:hypothetical protein